MADSEDAGAEAGRPMGELPSWRQLNPRLWVGHIGTTGLGTIEQGVRYVYVDPGGEVRRAYRTLDEAQSAATGAIGLPGPRPSVASRRPWLAILIHSTVLLAGLVMLGAAVWIVGWALIVT